MNEATSNEFGGQKKPLSMDSVKDMILDRLHGDVATPNSDSDTATIISACNQALAASLTCVEGDLIVQDNSECTIEFANLTKVTGNVLIRGNTNVNLSFPLLEEIGGDLVIGSEFANVVLNGIFTFQFPTLDKVGGRVLIGSDKFSNSGNIVVGNSSALSIMLRALVSVGSDLLIGTKRATNAGNFVLGDNSQLVIDVSGLESVGGSVVVGRVASEIIDGFVQRGPGNLVDAVNSAIIITIGSGSLVINDSLCIGAFDVASGGNWNDGALSKICITFGVKQVVNDVRIGAFDSDEGNGINFNRLNVDSAQFTIDFSFAADTWSVGGDLEIGAFSTKPIVLQRPSGPAVLIVENANRVAATDSSFAINLGPLSVVDGSVRIGAFGENATIGNRARDGLATLSIDGNSLETVGKDLLIGAFDGGSNGNSAAFSDDNIMNVLWQSVSQVGGAIKVGAFGQAKDRVCTNPNLSVRGNGASIGNRNTQIVDLSGLEHVCSPGGLTIGSAGTNIHGPIKSVSMQGNFAGDQVPATGVATNDNRQEVLFSSLKSVRSCAGLRIGAFGIGVKDGNYSGMSSSSGNTQNIDLGALKRVEGSVCIGAPGSCSKDGNGVFGDNNNTQTIDLSNLRSVDGCYKVKGNRKVRGDDQVWCYDASSLKQVTGSVEFKDNRGIKLITCGRAVRSSDCTSVNKNNE